MRSIREEVGRYFGIKLWRSLNRSFLGAANIKGIWEICVNLGRNVEENLERVIRGHLEEVL